MVTTTRSSTNFFPHPSPVVNNAKKATIMTATARPTNFHGSAEALWSAIVSARRVTSVGRVGGVTGLKSPSVDTQSVPSGGCTCHVVPKVVMAILGALWRMAWGRSRSQKPLVTKGGLSVS